MTSSKTTFLIVASIFLLGIFIQSESFLISDISCLLHLGNHFLTGGKYYTSFFEVNPPMCIYIYFPAVLLNKLTAWGYPICLRIYIFTMAGFSLVFCNYFLSSFKNKNILLVALAFCFVLQPAMGFGQREHLIVLFIMPYLFLMALRIQHRPVHNIPAAIAGLFAGIGFAIKPYFFSALIAIELYFLFREKKLLAFLHPEKIFILLIFVAYFISLFAITPEYITGILPHIWHFYYLAFAPPFYEIIFQKLTYFFFITMLVYLFVRKEQEDSVLTDIIAITAAFFYAAYLIQQTLWYYHALPAWILTFLLAILLLSSYVKKLKTVPSHSCKIISLHVVLFLASFLALAQIFESVCYIVIMRNYPTLNAMIHYFKINSKNDSIYFLEENVTYIFPIVDYGHLHYVSRFPSLWLIDSIELMEHKQPNNPRLQKEKQFFLNAVTEDIQRNKPRFIIVHMDSNLYLDKNIPIDYVKFFSVDPKFAALWHHYHFDATFSKILLNV